jgi:hypothetical protein
VAKQAKIDLQPKIACKLNRRVSGRMRSSKNSIADLEFLGKTTEILVKRLKSNK